VLFEDKIFIAFEFKELLFLIIVNPLIVQSSDSIIMILTKPKLSVVISLSSIIVESLFSPIRFIVLFNTNCSE